MKIIVLGAGVVGVTTAWYLAEQGHEVEVIDRQPGVALETSFANAGQVSPGYSTPWAMPGLPLKAARWLVSRHSPLVVRPAYASLPMARFVAGLLANCTSHAYEINKGRMLRIAEYSRDCLRALRQQTGLQYEGRQNGLIQLFRTEKQVEHAHEDMRLLDDSHIPHELLDVDGILRHEPGLAGARHLLVGGLRLPGDESGDCHLFTKRLAALAEEKGVTFRFRTRIEAIEAAADSITGVRTNEGRVQGDAYVLALGSYSPRMLKPIELRMPVYPVKGYSLTAPITDETRVPVGTVNDETYKVAITRFEDRIRIGGTAELTGWRMTLSPDRRETLELSFGDMFGGADLSKASYWTGLRPCTPDGTPIVGPAPRYGNLWLNTGHGTLGWTMACGSAKLLADRIGGRRTEIPALDLSLDRYTG
ncbi:D-amino acid dehydrogenase [Acidomonas methanolica]|uniref:D-amino acid dehydrogenase small subunit n=1 Tax=Acidomonas methanolica NBRC 104435 TaxID=1231351 RepID=A0A023D8U2_ACIMT|nr:D-amino acid dehydrogenase [Acidomonas methanolica]MBU2653769.1 D-amino acid dehydrogenase [Acidomonas methanolica]TCS31722.1 D-amino-acid dehydrogenase [Acidomonas methanolica]GAJ30186.1 D-amino acid dehydrogenase small subunit [Acidomonas methanolica NBRC 104435]GBQ55506.1 D-amino acid dehydrogenase small subunit [Acidomonas methanolica]GEK98138.1 D-amino acid dehydrogenase [Acidomonas methanolica NBRC 104435]